MNYKKQISIRARKYVMGTPEQSNWGTGPVQSTLQRIDYCWSKKKKIVFINLNCLFYEHGQIGQRSCHLI